MPGVSEGSPHHAKAEMLSETLAGSPKEALGNALEAKRNNREKVRAPVTIWCQEIVEQTVRSKAVRADGRI